MLLNISQHSAQTLQEQIIEQIRARILCDELQPDQPLTSIRALSQDLRVGVNTVQRAYEHLLRQELIYARPGKGFFVTPLEQSDKTELSRKRFAEALQSIFAGALREGLTRKDLKQICDKLQSGAENANP